MNQPELDVARLTVRLDAIVSNYRLCGRLAGPAAVAGVVKADGYGLGASKVARALASAGCDTFFVARLEEGVRLRPKVPTARIFVLDGVTPGSSCVVNAYTSNHDLIASKDTGAFKGFVLHAVDAVGIVHAMLLRIQALLMPIKTLVLTGH